MKEQAKDNIHYFSMSQLRDLYKNNEISPYEVTKYMFDRIQKHDHELKSYATLMEEDALSVAKTLSEKPKQRIGPLHGIPVAVKDLCYTKDVRTMGGTAVLENFIPKFDSTVVKKLREAGAIILGKLNTTEGAMGGYNPKRLAPRNPWDLEKWAGSSSSGSGVATSAGLCFGSLGSDTGGSIRYPSAANGVVGLKPTYGRVSRYGVLDLAKSLDHVGPMTRTVKDAWDMFTVIRGVDEMDPTTINHIDCNDLDDVDINEISIGYDDDYSSRGVDSEITNAVRDAVKVFESLKLNIDTVKMPPVEDYLSYWNVLCSAEAALAHAENYPSKKNQYGKWFGEWLQNGCEVTREDYINASIKRDESNTLISNSLKNVDVLIAPTLIKFPHYVDDEIHYGPIDKNRHKDTGKFTIPFNYNRYPTLTLPCGLSKFGFPIGLQIIGKPMTEPLICALGKRYEQLTEWNNMHPKNYID